MMLCDSLAGYRPGFVQLSDEQIKARWEARDGMIRSAQEAWRGPIETAVACEDVGSQPESARRKDLADGRRHWISPLTSEQATALLDARKKRPPDDNGDDDDEDGASLSDARAAALQARQEMIDRATSAWWRTPASPNRTSCLPAGNAGHPTSDGADLSPQQRRDAAYASYAAGLSEAWKASPARAVQVERERERVTAEAK
jgi:hypothetical protein